MNFYQIATLAVVLLSSLVQVNALGCRCLQYVVIEHGDRCSYVYGFDENKHYHVRYKDLIIFNPSLDCSKLKAGDKLCVNCDDFNNNVKKYIIKKGDTCESLAKKFKTTIYNLEDLNMNVLSCSSINYQVGNEIYYYDSSDYTPDFRNAEQVYIPSSSKRN